MKNNSVHKEVKYYNNERYVKVLKKFNVPVSPIPQKSKIKKHINSWWFRWLRYRVD